MANHDDPDYSTLFRREVVEALAKGTDKLAIWAQEMIASKDEEAVFLRGARAYFRNVDQKQRRRALAFLANMFEVNREDLKRYLRFKGIVNLMD